LIITNDLFIKFLIDLNASVTCPVCNQVGWSVAASHIMNTHDKNDDQVVNHLPFARIHEENNSTTTFLGGVPVLSVTCKACGYIRLHDYKTVFAHFSGATQEGKSVEHPKEE
jgi:hypothetical protein